MEARLKPPPYHRRAARFGWDSKPDIELPIGHEIVYANSVTGSQWTGTPANLNDPQKSGVNPPDTTPETFDGVVSINAVSQTLTLGFPTLAGGAGRMWIGIAAATAKNGVPAPVNGSTSFEVKIKSSTSSLVWKRTINLPTNDASIRGVEYEMNPDEMNLGGIDLATVQVVIQPFNMSGGAQSGMILTYFHFRFAPPA